MKIVKKQFLLVIFGSSCKMHILKYIIFEKFLHAKVCSFVHKKVKVEYKVERLNRNYYDFSANPNLKRSMLLF